ncbi:hypothetical protein CEXT_469921 [Caerostris extrusa]|uniref:Uncharacterized protein n=1 Tax=Caerostris extrusa TaxID=172846 RepID=A0AAV4Y0U0_CAEEX|nr:hypothetical protein CEXT_469921 [Caerostris extrusa]
MNVIKNPKIKIGNIKHGLSLIPLTEFEYIMLREGSFNLHHHFKDCLQKGKVKIPTSINCETTSSLSATVPSSAEFYWEISFIKMSNPQTYASVLCDQVP